MIINYKRRILRKSFMVLKYLKRYREFKEDMKLDLFEKECYEASIFEYDFDLRKIKLVLFK